METQIFPTASSAAYAAGSKLSDTLKVYGELPLLLLVSGGSAFKILELTDTSLLSPRVTLGVLDERYGVSQDDTNFYQLSQLVFFRRAREQHVYILNPLPHDDESLEKVATRYEKSVKKWQLDNPTGKIIITQGIGPDGHTAGIMPYPENPTLFRALFDSADVWVVGYDADKKNQFPKRITVTLPFLRMTDVSIVYACGQDKQGALVATRALDGTLVVTPARIINDMPSVFLFTDISP